MITQPQLRSAIAKLIGRRITLVEPLSGGQNSRSYLVRTTGGDIPFVVKLFSTSHHLAPDRLQTEFRSFEFLWKHGIRTIPRPVAVDPNAGLAVYHYVQGCKLAADEIREAHIDQLVLFLSKLKALTSAGDSCKLPAAAEACFSLPQINANIADRLARLKHVDCREPIYFEMQRFLNTEFKPLTEEVVNWGQKRVEALGIRYEALLPKPWRTLSPSDFGFHNALADSRGTLYFLDFEYFGWDDPAKTVTDFILHPAMSLTKEQKQYFCRQIPNVFEDYPFFRPKLAIVFPLFGLKWCLILLNEFIPSDYHRRTFALGSETPYEQILLRQLSKAKAMLNQIKAEYEKFPYI